MNYQELYYEWSVAQKKYMDYMRENGFMWDDGRELPKNENVLNECDHLEAYAHKLWSDLMTAASNSDSI